MLAGNRDEAGWAAHGSGHCRTEQRASSRRSNLLPARRLRDRPVVPGLCTDFPLMSSSLTLAQPCIRHPYGIPENKSPHPGEMFSRCCACSPVTGGQATSSQQVRYTRRGFTRRVSRALVQDMSLSRRILCCSCERSSLCCGARRQARLAPAGACAAGESRSGSIWQVTSHDWRECSLVLLPLSGGRIPDRYETTVLQFAWSLLDDGGRLLIHQFCCLASRDSRAFAAVRRAGNLLAVLTPGRGLCGCRSRS